MMDVPLLLIKASRRLPKRVSTKTRPSNKRGAACRFQTLRIVPCVLKQEELSFGCGGLFVEARGRYLCCCCLRTVVSCHRACMWSEKVALGVSNVRAGSQRSPTKKRERRWCEFGKSWANCFTHICVNSSHKHIWIGNPNSIGLNFNYFHSQKLQCQKNWP